MHKAGRIDSHPDLGKERKIFLVLTQKDANQILRRNWQG
jgi:hypothetical protein